MSCLKFPRREGCRGRCGARCRTTGPARAPGDSDTKVRRTAARFLALTLSESFVCSTRSRTLMTGGVPELVTALMPEGGGFAVRPSTHLMRRNFSCFTASGERCPLHLLCSSHVRTAIPELSVTSSNCHSQDLDDALSAKLAVFVFPQTRRSCRGFGCPRPDVTRHRASAYFCLRESLVGNARSFMRWTLQHKECQAD